MANRDTTDLGLPQPYKLPEEFAHITIGETYDTVDTAVSGVSEYFEQADAALIADLLRAGITPAQIEAAVNEGEVKATPWPQWGRYTDFFWTEDDEATNRLEAWADWATTFCYGQDEHEPPGGNVLTVGREIGSQQIALAGLVVAREQKKVWELPAELASPEGQPLYVPTGSFSERMFKIILNM